MQKAWGQPQSGTGQTGSIADGSLGVGDQSQHNSPTDVLGGVNFVAAQSYGNTGTLFLTDTGTVYYAGTNRGGCFGDGTASNSSSVRSTPTQVPGLTSITKVTCGNACYALDSSGVLRGWGSNAVGQMNRGSVGGADQLTPTTITTGVVDFDSNGFSLLVIKASNVVWALGANGPAGELGFGGTTNQPTLFDETSYVGGGTVVQVAVGATASFLLMADGTVKAAGANSGTSGTAGQLGVTASSTNTSWFTLPYTGAVEVFTGYNVSGIRMADDTLWGMGNNVWGQIGTGTASGTDTTGHISTPTQWLTPSGFLLRKMPQNSGARRSFGVVGQDGLLYTWGRGTEGEMGNAGTTTSNPTPASANGLTGVQWCHQGGYSQFASDNVVAAAAVGFSWAQVIG